MIDKERCEKGFIENPSNCEYECDKPCDVRQYLDDENCQWRKKFVHKLVKECSEIIDENEMISLTLNDYEYACGSCTIYIVLFFIVF